MEPSEAPVVAELGRNEKVAREAETGHTVLPFGLGRARLRRRVAEDDLAQEVFVRFFEKLSS